MKKHLYSKTWILIIILIDISISAISYYSSYFIRTHDIFNIFIHDFSAETLKKIPIELFLTLQVVVIYFVGGYEWFNVNKLSSLIKVIISAVTIQLLIITGYLVFIAQEIAPRSILILYPLIDIFLLMGSKYFIFKKFVVGQKKRVVLIGLSNTTKNIIQEIEKNPWMNIRVIGLIGTDDYPHDYFMNYPVLGKIEEAYSIVETFNIQNVIIVNEEDSWKDRAIININSYARTKPNIYIVPSFYDLMLSKLKYFRLHDIPMIQIQNNPNSLFRTCIKRIFDITLATTLLTFNMPLFIIISIANKIASRGKIFYLQERLGKNKKPFKIIKFRTMYNNAEKKTGAVLAEKNDPRITKIGSFLRKTRFDELPQLINIIKGDMTFIGPRPERLFFVDKYSKEVNGYNERFKVKPGLTGLAQIHGDYHSSPQNKLRYDLTYIYNYSILLDIIIIIETIKIIITRKGN